MFKRGTGTLAVLAVLLAGFAGGALAGNGNGNGNGNGQGNGNANGHSDAVPAQASPSPGNSGNAPGQDKDKGKATDPASPASSAPGQDKKSSEQAKPSAPAGGPAAGVKPSNSTAKNTNAPAGSNKTKLYGNGKTAGQIAMQHGYPASGNLYGPGNSQPHKVVTCGHRHGVDVHALKSHPAKGCGSPPQPPTHDPNPPKTSEPPVVPPHGSPSDPGSKPVKDPVKRPAPDSGTAGSRSLSGVLSATMAAGTSELPFTGFPLWAAVLAALVLIACGLALLRLTRAPA